MNNVTVQDKNLIIEPQGFDKIWGFQGKLTIPLTHVRGVAVEAGIVNEPKGLRAPGLDIGHKVVGTFYHDNNRTYWNVSNSTNSLVITLKDEHFDQLVLTVANAHEIETLINTAIA